MSHRHSREEPLKLQKATGGTMRAEASGSPVREHLGGMNGHHNPVMPIGLREGVPVTEMKVSAAGHRRPGCRGLWWGGEWRKSRNGAWALKDE